MSRTITRTIMRTWMIILLIVAVTSGCGSKAQFSEDKINVLTSFYPLYDLAREIGGDHVQVINMIPAGVDPHDWSPKSQDLVNLTKGQLFVYNGAGFDDWWVEDMLASINSGKKPHVVKASEGLTLISVSDTDSVEEESSTDDHDHEHDHSSDGHAIGDGHDHDHGDYDPHTWLSLLNAITMAGNIKDGLIAVDPDNRADYEANYEKLRSELMQLHEQFAQMVERGARREFVTSHRAFAYLARDYGLTQLSVMGLSTEAEPTSQAIKEISDFIRDHGVRYLLLEELASPKLAETLARDLGIGILTLNPIEGLTKEQEASGEDYLSLMRHNLASLELALQE